MKKCEVVCVYVVSVKGVLPDPCCSLYELTVVR